MPAAALTLPRTLMLIVPGLLGPVPPTRGAMPPADLCHGLDAPALATVLSRARSLAPPGGVSSVEELQCALLAPEPLGPPWPMGAIALLGAGGAPGTDAWLRLDPVCLRPTMTELVMLAPGVVDLQPAESDTLLGALRAHFTEDGWQVEAPGAGQWFLRLSAPPDMRTHPPSRVTGQAVARWLPAGPDAGPWHRWLNEAQMVLHACPVNDDREGRGLPPANSVWPWGGGALPAEWPAPAQGAGRAAVLGGECLAAGLARLAGAGAGPLPAGLVAARAAAPGATGIAAVVTATEGPARDMDVFAWQGAVAGVEEAWLAPALGALRRRELDRLELWVDPGRGFELTTRAARRWWRRRRPLPALLGAGGDVPAS